jgi:hypothetical protein
MLKLPFDIKEIKPGEFTYFSRRKLENKEGEVAGEIFVWKRKDDEEHSFALECPYCLKQGEGNIDLKRRPYRVRCTHCDRSITLKKLKNT